MGADDISGWLRAISFYQAANSSLGCKVLGSTAISASVTETSSFAVWGGWMWTTAPFPQGRHWGKDGRSKETTAHLFTYLVKQENGRNIYYSLMAPIVPWVPKELQVVGLCSHPASAPGLCQDIPKISSYLSFSLLPERQILLPSFEKKTPQNTKDKPIKHCQHGARAWFLQLPLAPRSPVSLGAAPLQEQAKPWVLLVHKSPLITHFLALLAFMACWCLLEALGKIQIVRHFITCTSRAWVWAMRLLIALQAASVREEAVEWCIFFFSRNYAGEKKRFQSKYKAIYRKMWEL